MNDQKRTGLAIALIFLVMVGWMYLYQHLYPPPPPQPAASEAAAAPAAAAEDGKEAPAQEAKASDPKAEKRQSASVSATPELTPREITVETPLVRAVFTTRGADIVSWQLKKHLSDVGNESYEMVKGVFGAKGPLATRIAVGGTELADSERVFAYEGPEKIEIATDEKKTLEFKWVDDEGFKWIKKITLSGDGYGITLVTVTSGGAAPSSPLTLSLSTAFNATTAAGEVSSQEPPKITLSTQGKLHNKTPKDVLEDAENLSAEALDGWAGLGIQYFLYAWAPDNAPLSKAEFRKAEAPDMVAARITLPERARGSGDTGPLEQEISVFLGPKDRERVAAFGHGLIAAIDFGFFAKLARALLWVLLKLEPLVNDYGWAIIFLTLLVRIVLFPLSVWQFKSMRAMQHIAPLLKEVREKYKSDAQRQQQEMMNLYRQHKVNPFGGCLPMLAQIPVFLALYTALMNAIELRHAAWGATWIHDLSHKDPYYVLPVLMTATTYLSMRLSPNPGTDPAQQKMMQIMPLFFLFLFISMPAGLVLYWTVSNVLSIGQQLYINRAAKAAEGVAHPSMLPETETVSSPNDAQSARRKGRRKK